MVSKFNIDDLSINFIDNSIAYSENENNQNIKFSEDYKSRVIDILVENQYSNTNISGTDSRIIDDYTYVNNNNITEFNLNNTEYIGIGAFEFCENLTTINANSNTVNGITLCNSSFANCGKLKEFNVRCNNLPDRCFYGCHSLTKIILNENSKIDSIGNDCFNGCTELRNIDISKHNISSIGALAFYNCLSLRHIVFNNSLTTIEALAFANCNLNTVIIPKTVKFIETSAFEGNIGLQQVIFEHSANDIIYLNDNIFNKCPNVTIISKNDSIAEYAKRNKLKFRAN